MSRNITFYVCPNGLGHFRRVLSVSDALLKEDRHRIRIICTKKQYESRYFWNFEYALSKNAIEFHQREIPAETGWMDEAKAYSFERYMNWVQELKNEELLKDEIVVSDNLAAILAERPDALLMGSFLWPDVLKVHEAHKDVAEIISYEKELLSRQKPQMICIGDMAMPAISELCEPATVSWFTEKREASNGDAILISAGDTGSYQEAYLKAMQELADEGYRIYCDGRLYKIAAGQNIPVSPFSFSDAEYRNIGLIVCRPGIGILSEALEREIPVIALNDGFNPEMMHNASRVDELKMGISHPLHAAESLPEVLRSVIKKHKNQEYSYLCNAPFGGAKEAATIIAQYAK